jgi:hypothetical protein
MQLAFFYFLYWRLTSPLAFAEGLFLFMIILKKKKDFLN